MNSKRLLALGLALVAALSVNATLPVDVNWQGVGLIYASNPGQSTVGTTPGFAVVWSALQTFGGGITASGAVANDFSGSTGAFKTSTGASTFGGSTNTFTLGFAVGGGQVQTLLNNYSVASQAPAATTRTYITGSTITVPAAKLQIGTIIKWRFNMTKTAAGTATSTIDIALGTAGTTADTAVVSFTKPGGTAAADEAFCDVECIFRGPLSASGVIVGEFIMSHNLAATGHAQIPVVVVNTVSGSVDLTTASLKVGLCITTGASDAITIQQVTAQALNL